MKKLVISTLLIASTALFTSCSGTFNAAEATELTLTANGYTIQIASANGDKGYDALVEACSGAVYKGELDDCAFGNVSLTFVIDGEEITLYPCNDENCEYIAKGDLNSEKVEYLKVNEDERKAIFDFINEYAS